MTKKEFSAMSLPHGLKVYNGLNYDCVVGFEGNEYTYTVPELFELSLKPILRPLSDLTKPIEHKGTTFTPIVELAKIAGFRADEDCFCGCGSHTFTVRCHDNIDFEYSIKYKCFTAYDRWAMRYAIVQTQLQLFQKLVEWHFNLMDDTEEFIDVNSIDVNPYK